VPKVDLQLIAPPMLIYRPAARATMFCLYAVSVYRPDGSGGIIGAQVGVAPTCARFQTRGLDYLGHRGPTHPPSPLDEKPTRKRGLFVLVLAERLQLGRVAVNSCRPTELNTYRVKKK
jgi:hypothetical protein